MKNWLQITRNLKACKAILIETPLTDFSLVKVGMAIGLDKPCIVIDASGDYFEGKDHPNVTVVSSMNEYDSIIRRMT